MRSRRERGLAPWKVSPMKPCSESSNSRRSVSWTSVGIFVWMLASMLLYDTAYTIIGLVYSALLPEVAESDAERNGLQVSSSLFGLLGTLLGFMIPDMVRPKEGGGSLAYLQTAMVVVAVVAALLIIAVTFRVRERPEFTRVDKPIPLGRAIRLTFTSRSFIVLALANFMTILMQALLLGTIFYLADYVLKAKSSMLVLAFLFVPLVIGVTLTPLLRRGLGVVGAQQLLLLIAGAGLVAITFVPTGLILPCIALAGFGLSGPQTLTNVLFGQVVDEDELRSGVRREGAFFGVNALITKPAQSVAIALMGGVAGLIAIFPAALPSLAADGGAAPGAPRAARTVRAEGKITEAKFFYGCGM